jgi:Uma2 family endonuclease
MLTKQNGLEMFGDVRECGISIYDRRMATTTPMSFADFERLESEVGKVELLRGEVLRKPPAPNVEMDICEALYGLLKSAVEGARTEGVTLGKIHFLMGYRLPADPASWLQPDVSLTHPDQSGDRYYLGGPLIAFEVVSENDRAPKLNAKVAEYLANGTAEVWLIYPEQRLAWVYDGSGTAREESNSVHTGLLPGIEILFSEIL